MVTSESCFSLSASWQGAVCLWYSSSAAAVHGLEVRHERLPFTETRLGVEHVNISPGLKMPLHHSRQPMLSCHRCCNAHHFPERSRSLGLVLAEHLLDEVIGNDEAIFVNAQGAVSQHRHWSDRVHQFLLSGMINLVKTRWLPSSAHRLEARNNESSSSIARLQQNREWSWSTHWLFTHTEPAISSLWRMQAR